MIKLLLSLLVISTPFAFAEINMYADQSEYYFLIGENAVIPLEIVNDHGQPISGMLQYMVTQQIRQGNAQFSSSSTQSSTFTINDGDQIASFDFGTRDTPSTLVVNLSFIYNDNEQINVSLDPITIHFVSDESEKNNTQDRMQSSTQTSPIPQQSAQQALDELINQDPQQRLQNNQLAQDNTALKRDIQEQLQEEDRLREDFERQLVSNEDFQRAHQELLQQGYNATSANLSPSSSLTGDFKVDYQDEQGRWANLQGSMTNGTISEIERQTQEEQESLLLKLYKDPTFQRYEQQLASEGFAQQNIEFIVDKNMTLISITYQDEKIQTATITAEFQGNDITRINLEKPGSNDSYLYLLGLVPLAIIAYILYKKLKRTKKLPIIEKSIPKKIDHISESYSLIQQAKRDFEYKRYKDAYGKVSQAIRLYLSYELNLNKEITNEDILSYIDTKYPIDDIKHCFELSSLVEFAKHTPDEDKFKELIALAEELIRR